MAWYRLNLPVRAEDLDGKLDEYRDMVQGAIARMGGRDMSARVYCARRPGGAAEVFLDIEGKQPPWYLLRLVRLEAIPEPPRSGLELLGEVVDGAARAADPLRPA
jgi:hypothetical protein